MKINPATIVSRILILNLLFFCACSAGRNSNLWSDISVETRIPKASIIFVKPLRTSSSVILTKALSEKYQSELANVISTQTSHNASNLSKGQNELELEITIHEYRESNRGGRMSQFASVVFTASLFSADRMKKQVFSSTYSNSQEPLSDNILRFKNIEKSFSYQTASELIGQGFEELAQLIEKYSSQN